MVETLQILIGFAVGAGGVMAMHYVQNNLIDGGASGGSESIVDTVPLMLSPAFDAAVMMV